MDDISEKRHKIAKKIKSFIELDNSEGIDISEKRDKLVKFAKTNRVYYVLLLPILLLAYYIRTRNVSLLNGKYLLGLDPYSFYRYAQEIFQTGTLITHDMMRYAPLGYDLRIDYKFLSYILAYAYKIIHIIFPSMSQLEWHIIYPPIATVISLVIFFLFVRTMFDSKVGLLATAFLSVIPAYIYRTGAGFADHEALAMLFMFLTLWLFSLMWKSDLKVKSIILGGLAGVATVCTYFSWPGGYRFLIIPLAIFILIATLFTKISKSQFLGYVALFITVIILNTIGLGKITFIKELETLIFVFSIVILVINQIPQLKNIFKKINHYLPYKFPVEFLIIITFALGGLIFGWITGLIDPTVVIERILHPGGLHRLAFTVSENQQPYFMGGNGWWSGFGWTFILGFFGSMYLLMKMFKSVKTSALITLTYLVFFLIFIFGRFSSEAKYARIIAFSSQTYLLWFVVFMSVILFTYLRYYNKKPHEFKHIFQDVYWGYILVFVMFLFTAIIARGAARTIFSFAPAVAIVAAFFTINIAKELYKQEGFEKILSFGIVLFAIFCIYSNMSVAMAINSNSGSGLPGQWEDAMFWIRDNTASNAVIAHWWDYGYWTQTIGERASVVDGGNAMGWDHGIGRYGLTNNNLTETFDYFKTHKVTHLLISEEEIGKYHAFATIGSDEEFDRRSTIGMFVMAEQKELREGIEYAYQGGWGLDQDIISDMRVIPEGTPLGGISIINNADGSFQAPIAHFFPNGQQLSMKVPCLVFQGEKYLFNVDEPKVDACIVLLPYFMDEQNSNAIGTAFFVSSKVKDGNLARLLLYEENILGFKLVYDDGTPLGVYRGNIIGPIKIWEIEYPSTAKVDEKYLERSIYG